MIRLVMLCSLLVWSVSAWGAEPSDRIPAESIHMSASRAGIRTQFTFSVSS